MKVFLVGLNSSYMHSNPALYMLKKMSYPDDIVIQTGQWTINSSEEDILDAIIAYQPQIIGFSAYIWNIEYLKKLAADLKRIMPSVLLLMGGPQATGENKNLLEACPAIDLLILGEGERLLPLLLTDLAQGHSQPTHPGLLWQGQEDLTFAPYEDFSDLPFLYDAADLQELKGKIIYYESSRGCPYRCSFCSSANQPLRQRDLALVKEELAFLAGIGEGQIKFVDRTFNSDPQRAGEICQYLLELYQPGLSWHLEISPYNLSSDFLAILQKAPAGYFRLEAGVQSLHPPVLQAIGRHGQWDKAKKNIQRLMAADNLHLHLDLIAGLPYENSTTFSYAFNELHALAPHYLQLGFLKILPGSLLAEEKEKFTLVYRHYPPYQILSTADQSAQELLLLRRVEEMVDAFYNCRRFRQSLYQAGIYWPGGAMAFYQALAEEKAAYCLGGLALKDKFRLLWNLFSILPEKELLLAALQLDWLLYSNGEPLPDFLPLPKHQGVELSLAFTPCLQEGGLYNFLPHPCLVRADKKKRVNASQACLLDIIPS